MSEENPRLAMYEAQAIAIEKQLKIDKLEQEKEELLEVVKRLGRGDIGKSDETMRKNVEKEEMDQLKTKNVELEERLRKIEQQVEGKCEESSNKTSDDIWSNINALTGQFANIQNQIEEINARFKDFQEKMEENNTKVWDAVNDLRKEDLPKNIVNKLQAHENTILILGGWENGWLDYGILVLSPDRSKWIQPQLKLSVRAGGHGVVYLNEEIYLIVGFQLWGKRALRDLKTRAFESNENSDCLPDFQAVLQRPFPPELETDYIGGYQHPKRLCKLDKNLKWINLADMNVGRKFITKSCLEWNGYIWVFGGKDENQKALKSVERYDPKENKWILMPNMKQARYGAAAVLWNDRIIVTGGRDFLNSQLNTIECFKDDCWTTLANLPNPLYSHSLLLYKNKLLVFGGRDEKAYNNVWDIDPNELTRSTNAKWQQLLPMKARRYLCPGTFLNDEIYVIGGYTGIKGSEYLDCVEIFNGEKWRNGPSLPHGLCEMPAVIIPQTLADRLCNYNP